MLICKGVTSTLWHHATIPSILQKKWPSCDSDEVSYLLTKFLHCLPIVIFCSDICMISCEHLRIFVQCHAIITRYRAVFWDRCYSCDFLTIFYENRAISICTTSQPNGTAALIFLALALLYCLIFCNITALQTYESCSQIDASEQIMRFTWGLPCCVTSWNLVRDCCAIPNYWATQHKIL